MKTYLVTGGAGFIGSNFIRYMLKTYEDIRICNFDALAYSGNLENLRDVESDSRYAFTRADICDAQAVSRVFSENSVDYVIHFAAESHVDRSIENPNIFAQTNVMGTLNLLNAAVAAWKTGEDTYRPGVKFLHVSTDEVYGTLEKDGFFTESTPLFPHSPYSASKASSDMFVLTYADTYKLPVNITRCSNNYGPFQFPEKLIPLMINNAFTHEPLPVYGDGMQVRDWLYVEDHCRALDAVVHRAYPGEVYNVGGHNERYNIDVVKTIITHIQENMDDSVGEGLIRHVTDRKGHDRRYAIDPSKIRSDLGWEPRVSFEEGIRATIDWYYNNRAWMDGVTSGVYRKYYERMYASR